MPKPVVALVGRPNVGKSTLFNRLCGERLAIVDDTPGTTRDRLFAEAEWSGRVFDVVDTGGIDPRAGSRDAPLSVGSADFIEEIRAQAVVAVTEADVVLFLVDATSGITPADKEVAGLLRKAQKVEDGIAHPPILLVVNIVGEWPGDAAIAEMLAMPGVHVHNYAKSPRAGRKIGHVTLVGCGEREMVRVLELCPHV